MDYQGNSKKGKAEAKKKADAVPEKKVEKVVTGEVITRKTPLGRKIKETFFGGDARSVTQYIVAEVLLPAFRNVIVDASTKGVERMVYGDMAPRRGPASEYRPKVTYNTPISRSRQEPRYSGRANLPDQRRHSDRQGTEMILSSRGEAEMVLERMNDIIDKYDVASMADLRELVGLSVTPVDNKWGWIDLYGVEIRQVREGWLMDLPAAEPLN